MMILLPAYKWKIFGVLLIDFLNGFRKLKMLEGEMIRAYYMRCGAQIIDSFLRFSFNKLVFFL